MRISDWSSDVCSSDLNDEQIMIAVAVDPVRKNHFSFGFIGDAVPLGGHADDLKGAFFRSEQAAPRHRIEGFPINVALPHNPPFAIGMLYAFDRIHIAVNDRL